VTLKSTQKSENAEVDPNDPKEILRQLSKEINGLQLAAKAIAATEKMAVKTHDNKIGQLDQDRQLYFVGCEEMTQQISKLEKEI